jgi:hypothetical protein
MLATECNERSREGVPIDWHVAAVLQTIRRRRLGVRYRRESERAAVFRFPGANPVSSCPGQAHSFIDAAKPEPGALGYDEAAASGRRPSSSA